jgi:hypothetical protein
MALKCMIDGKESVNLVTTVNRDGQNSWNVFENAMSTHIPLSTDETKYRLLRHFETGTPYIQSISVSDWAD